MYKPFQNVVTFCCIKIEQLWHDKNITSKINMDEKTKMRKIPKTQIKSNDYVSNMEC